MLIDIIGFLMVVVTVEIIGDLCIVFFFFQRIKYLSRMLMILFVWIYGSL